MSPQPAAPRTEGDPTDTGDSWSSARQWPLPPSLGGLGRDHCQDEGKNSKAAERPMCWERRADRSVETVEETRLNARPFVLQDAVDNRVTKGAVLTFNVPPEDSFPPGTELGDGRLRARVQQIGPDLDPAVRAVFEAVRRQQQLGLCIDPRTPPGRPVKRRAEVDRLIVQVRFQQRRCTALVIAGNGLTGRSRAGHHQGSPCECMTPD